MLKLRDNCVPISVPFELGPGAFWLYGLFKSFGSRCTLGAASHRFLKPAAWMRYHQLHGKQSATNGSNGWWRSVLFCIRRASGGYSATNDDNVYGGISFRNCKRRHKYYKCRHKSNQKNKPETTGFRFLGEASLHVPELINLPGQFGRHPAPLHLSCLSYYAGEST